MILKATSRFAETRLDDEVVLMNSQSGEFFALKGTGLAIWNLIDGTRDTATICAELTEAFDVDAAQCQADVAEFIARMAKAGFVEHH
jgi:PqqD family protein of HPr-rel-A system